MKELAIATACVESLLYFLLIQDISAESLNHHHSNYALMIKQM